MSDPVLAREVNSLRAQVDSLQGRERLLVHAVDCSVIYFKDGGAGNQRAYEEALFDIDTYDMAEHVLCTGDGIVLKALKEAIRKHRNGGGDD